jgi:hypothetical protein
VAVGRWSVVTREEMLSAWLSSGRPPLKVALARAVVRAVMKDARSPSLAKVRNDEGLHLAPGTPEEVVYVSRFPWYEHEGKPWVCRWSAVWRQAFRVLQDEALLWWLRAIPQTKFAIDDLVQLPSPRPVFSVEEEQEILSRFEIETPKSAKRNTPESLKEWLGPAYTGKAWQDELIEVVCNGSPEERLAAFEKLSALQEKVSDTRYEDKNVAIYQDENPYASMTVEGRVGYEWENGLRSKRKRGKQRDRTGAIRIVRAGRATYTGLGNDVPAIRLYLQSWAQDRDWKLERLSVRGKRGRSLTDEDRDRLRVLAEGVRAALAEGAKQNAVAEVLGWNKQAVSNLLGSY